LLELRLAVLAVAEVTGESGLSITALERWLGSGAPGGSRSEILLDLARRRRAAGDADGAASALSRATSEGASATAVLVELDTALPARSSDGQISLYAARAEALAAQSESDQRGTALAFRELGAAHWDLASDPLSAFAAWERALPLDPARGVECYASDLLAYGGPDAALHRLEDLAGRRTDADEAARELVASPAKLAARYRNTDPQDDLSDVIRVPRPGPQPAADELTFILRFCIEGAFLPVCNDFNGKSNHPNQKADKRKDTQLDLFF
jgi:hypothetical protein